MARVLSFASVLLLMAVGLQSPARALSPAVLPLTVGAQPSAIPAGNTFQAVGHCLEGGTTVRIELVRQPRPGVAAKVVQTHTAAVDANHEYSAMFTNDLRTVPGFPVDAQLFATCGALTAQAPFVSTDLAYPTRRFSIMTFQADGPCGLCVAHLKGFDASGNLSEFANSYVSTGSSSGTLAPYLGDDFTATFVGTGPGVPASVAISGGGGVRPYGDFAGGVEIAANFTDDNGFDFVTGPGAGGGPHVKLFKGNHSFGFDEVGGFFAYDSSFSGGVRVAVGDVTGDSAPEIITAAGPGGGPHIRVFTVKGQLISEFYAYAPAFRGGVSIGVGDVVPGGKNEIVTGAGPGGAPHVRTFDALGNPIGNGFYAYDQSFGGGVWVSVGDIDHQGGDDIATGAGAGGMPHVRWFTTPDGATDNNGFFAYEDIPTGVRVAVPARPAPAPLD